MKTKIKRSEKMDAVIGKVFGGPSTPQPFRRLYPKIAADLKQSISRFRPWSWFIELTHGCNLSCAFCAARLLGKNYKFMSLGTWIEAIDIIAEVSPICRIDMANLGEPTLNPNIYEMFRYAKNRCPTLQLLMYTNGTTLLSGDVSYEKLFDSGLNMVFVDMYAPKERHMKLAQESGAHIIEEDNPKDSDINIFEYQDDPGIRAIRLCRNPGQWLQKKKRRFQTWLNNLDWEVAKKIGLEPVTCAPQRRCDQPFKYPNIYYDGSYALCCQDGMMEIAGKIGNVSSGVEGFFDYWFGKFMQSSRRRLDNKDRNSHPLCKRCKMADGRCDVPMWRDKDKVGAKEFHNELLDWYWSDSSWKKI